MLCIVFILGQSHLLRQSTQHPHPSLNFIYLLFISWLSASFAVQGALRASPAASPPQNMQSAIIFNGIWVSAAATHIFFLRGKQARRERDEQMYAEQGVMDAKPIQMAESLPQALSEKTETHGIPYRIFF